MPVFKEKLVYYPTQKIGFQVLDLLEKQFDDPYCRKENPQISLKRFNSLKSNGDSMRKNPLIFASALQGFQFGAKSRRSEPIMGLELSMSSGGKLK